MQLQLEKDPSLKRPQKTFFVLFGLLFLIAPFYYQPNFGGEGLYLPYNSSIWLIASWFIAAGSFLVYHRNSLIVPKYWLGLALLPIGTIFTGFIVENSNPTEWAVRVSVITGGYLFFIALFQFQLKQRHIERSLYILIAAGLIIASYGIIQIHTDLRSSNLFPISPTKQPIGIFQQVNLQASIMATMLILTFYVASRPAILSFNFFIKLSLCFIALAASYNIAMAGSRVGLLGSGIGLFLLFVGRWRLFKTSKVLVVLLMCSTIVGGALGNEGLSRTTSKLDRAIGGMSADVRWSIYKMSWNAFSKAPVLGHGVGGFQKAFITERIDSQSKGEMSLGLLPRMSHPHNEIMFWLVEGGLVALIGIVSATIFTFAQLVRSGWQRGFGYAALLVPIVLHTQVELPFYISNTHWLLLIVILFILNQHEKREISLSALSRTALATIPISFCLIAIMTTSTTIKAQIANAGIVNYFLAQERIPAYLNTPLNMWYFRNYTTYLLLQRNMRTPTGEENQKAAAQTFINWGEQAIDLTPGVQIYRDLAYAYDILGDKSKRDTVLATALLAYENYPDLLNAQQYFFKKDAGSSAVMTTPEVTSAASMSQDQKLANP